MPALALEVQHRVDDVLEHLRPRDRAFLRDVADQKPRGAGRLGELQKLARRLAHLADRAGRGGEVGGEHRLDRVDDDDVGFCLLRVLDDAFEVVLGDDEELLLLDAHAVAAEFDLRGGFLAGDVEHRLARARNLAQGLQQDRRLTDAGVAAQERHRAGDVARSQDAVELLDAGRDVRAAVAVDIGDGHGILREFGHRGARVEDLGRLLGIAVPLPAVRAAPEPPRALRPAVLTCIDGLRFGHARGIAGKGCEGKGMRVARSRIHFNSNYKIVAIKV